MRCEGGRGLHGNAKVREIMVTSAFASLGTSSPQYFRDHAMFLPWWELHLAIIKEASKALLEIPAIGSFSWYVLHHQPYTLLH